MRFVVTGSRGQLGRALVSALERRGEGVLALDRAALDVADPATVKARFESLAEAPRAVFNAAAFTHVDRCEREEETARRVNGVAPGLLAEACRAAGSQLVHVSTDYVFAGDAARPYTERDPVDPRSVYGRSKLEGERRVLETSERFLVVRTSWVFGRGRNFLAAILEQARKRRSGEARGPLRVVDDQKGRPTWAVDLAEGLLGLVERDARGLYHLANRGVASWWDLARACLDESGFRDLRVERIATADLDLPAPRPAWSVLDCSRAEALGVRLRHWREALAAYLASEDSPRAGHEENG